MTDTLRFRNLVSEATHCAEIGHNDKAILCLEEARTMLLPKIYEKIRPEDDPGRSQADRAAWRASR